MRSLSCVRSAVEEEMNAVCRSVGQTGPRGCFGKRGKPREARAGSRKRRDAFECYRLQIVVARYILGGLRCTEWYRDLTAMVSRMDGGDWPGPRQESVLQLFDSTAFGDGREFVPDAPSAARFPSDATMRGFRHDAA
jgi:hypothetical protein